ncbi:hypothetical protein QR680_008145 [Steinernema hermaphroditum]|uniref:Galectin n=1 Tax=Steinernema hermaphroditum TaxID=289476 RepID=A0AA39M7K9_9BILA|nr:hypothetical protein QR680_008145 [Steinernema hermaphroditum]
MHVITYPSVPFTTPISESLEPGCKIDIHGRAPDDHDDFKVELLSGPHIVLHVNFRFWHHEHAVVVNAASFGNWGCEVRHHNPIHRGEHFHLHITVHEAHYHIKVNGHHIADFPHRFPYESVQALGIRGCAHIEKVHFEDFPFHNEGGWGSHFDYGHGGYDGYGSDSYVAPEFHEGHHHHRHFF